MKHAKRISATRRLGLMVAASALGAAILGGSLGLADGRTAQEVGSTMADPSGTIVSVTGTGRVTSTPDRASVSIGVTHTAKTAAEAQAEVSADLDRVIKAMRGLDIEGMVLTTSNISLNPVYDYDNRRGNNTRVLRGYQAANTLSVRIDEVDRLAEVLDSAVLTGSNQINGVSFQLRDSNQAQLEALADATARARERADAIARALGREVETVLEVSEQGARPSPIIQRAMVRGAAMADAAPTPIEPGELDTTARVTMTVRLSD